ncbi:MAG TPA: hypothetical protein VH912_26675 [Streptosporangiaceae bacterium]
MSTSGGPSGSAIARLKPSGKAPSAFVDWTSLHARIGAFRVSRALGTSRHRVPPLPAMMTS